MQRAFIGLATLSVLLAGCTSQNVGPNIRVGNAAYDLIPAPTGYAAQSYRIGPLDTVEISVFQEPDISAKGVLVDASGNIAMPLIGSVRVAGLTTIELAELLKTKFGQYYVHPEVTVAVSSSIAQRVTVEGEVTDPGIYPIPGPVTLLDTIALAKGETENAALRQVVVVRLVNGERTGAVFDVRRIRRGDDKDPAIQARDVIIVGNSKSKRIFHDVLRSAPLLNVFSRF